MHRYMRNLFFDLVITAYLIGSVNAAETSLVINEFMASNNTSIQDPQGEYDDWIEIHNFGGDAIDIGGMYLTDNPGSPMMWRIPGNDPAATIVPPGGHLLIWADGDDSDPGLHANFKLDADGEEISLFKSDGITMIDSVVFGEQTSDISYGRYPNGTDNWRFFGSPSPAAENIGTYEGFVAELQFSRKGGLYNTPFSVTLATDTEDTTIYYTLDGSEPYELGSRFGTVYMGPITISRTTYLKAVATKTGWKPSDIVMQAYIFFEPSVRNFSSNLPIAVVDTLGKSINQTSQTLSFASFIDITADGRARLTDPPDFVGRAGINVRGKSSAGFPKKQYHFETWDQYDQDKDVSILGFPAESDWVLQGPYSDKSLMRNFLTYKWANDLGRYAVRTRFIEMFLNTGGGGISSSDYVGVYIFMEKIKLGADRVDIEELQPSDNAEPQISGGYIFKKDKSDPGETVFYTSSGLEVRVVEPKMADITPEQVDWLRNYLNQFEAALYGSNFRDPVNGYAKYIDVDSFIDNHIMVELTKNIDGFRLSTYMFKDRNGKINMGPVWDYNLSLGNADYNQGWIPTGWYYSQLGESNYPWWRRIFEDPVFRLRYADRWFEFRESVLATDQLFQDIYDTAILLNEAADRNFDRWHILGIDIWPNWFIADTYSEEINWMSGWLEQRLDWMDSQIGFELAAAPPRFSPQDGQFDHSFELAITNPNSSGTIYYSVDGNDPGRLATMQVTTTTLASPSAPKRVLVPAAAVSNNWKGAQAFDDSSWTYSSGNPGGVGYERSSGYQSRISLDVESLMYNTRTTCYVRIPFTVSSDLSGFNFMALNMRYDDGFVAYLNGVEVKRIGFSGTPIWNSQANGNHEDGGSESFDISEHIGALRFGANILAIHGLNVSTTSSDFLIYAELVAGSKTFIGDVLTDSAIEYTAPVTLDQSTHVKARVLSSDQWSAVHEVTFGVGPVGENLRITEIMYRPDDPDDPNDPNEEYIEMKNIGAETINLNLVSFTNGIDFTFPSLELAAGGYIVVVQDRNAFEARYGTAINIAGEYAGRLNNGGERIRLEDAIGQTILDFSYKDGWRSITDGEGFSLTIIDSTNPDLSSWNEKDSWRPSSYAGGSPGQDDSGIIPNPGAIVINEVLAHSHAEASDWIELYNTTGTAIDIGGWFLSDSTDNLFKYKIANGTTIGPNGYLVLYEALNFGNANDPGSYEPFALSENGERLYISSAQNDVLTGYRNVEDFGASETGVSFGRYYKSSTGNYNFVAMGENTQGSANSYPKVGPIVISEIMYNPDWPVGGSYTNDQYEYIELHNISAEPVTLYDYDKGEPWKFTDGVEFTFGADVPVTIGASGYLLVVKKPAAFSWRYPAVPAETIFGPYDGNLSNAGERLELSMPGDVDQYGKRYYIRVDRVNYSDGSHPEDCPGSVDLWPVETDGNGIALTRKVPTDYGNDPDNWIASPASPSE